MLQRTLLFIMLFTVIISCKNNSKHTSQSTPKNISKELFNLQNSILGEWNINDDSLYSLTFNKNSNNDEFECVFYNGGPFQEYLTCKFIDNKRIDLYFDYIAGSISFSEMNNPSNEDYCKVKVISCSLINENQLLIETHIDKCGQIIGGEKIKLTKVIE